MGSSVKRQTNKDEMRNEVVVPNEEGLTESQIRSMSYSGSGAFHHDGKVLLLGRRRKGRGVA